MSAYNLSAVDQLCLFIFIAGNGQRTGRVRCLSTQDVFGVAHPVLTDAIATQPAQAIDGGRS
jgi:hypothetical protein